MLIFLSVADCGLLQLSTLGCKDNKAVRTLQDLHQDDHFLVLEQVERAGLKVGGVLQEHFSDLLVKLSLHRLEQMAVTHAALRVRHNRLNCLPASVRLKETRMENCKSKQRHHSDIKESCPG